MGIPARQSHLQDIHFLRATLTLAELVAASTGGIQIGTLPAGARVLRSHTFVETAFNAGTTNVFDVGSAADPDQFITTANALVGATGLKTLAPPALQGVIAAELPVIAIYSQTGTAASAGLLTVVIEYAPNN